MKLTKHNIYRHLQWICIKFLSYFIFDRSSDAKVRKPKNLNESQIMAIDITVKSILNPDSELYFDIMSQECYIKVSSPDGDIYVFIESRNIKIINTVFGYDIPVDLQTENYISSVFRREMNKRRVKFKNEVVGKIKFSLQKVLQNINDKVSE